RSPSSSAATARLITRPIAQAVDSAQRIAKGDLTQAIITERTDEAGQLLMALSDMQGGLKSTLVEIANALVMSAHHCCSVFIGIFGFDF
ncbi:HAMP domain-containing protein, partial [Klebsiella pneumoniae]|uniref:HAMP domain-containing protein n=1 Tax=Klebsiella pneumoniae TaxID=573 RepID=UPI002732281B